MTITTHLPTQKTLKASHLNDQEKSAKEFTRKLPRRASLKRGYALIPQLSRLARDLEVTTDNLFELLEFRLGLMQTAFDHLPQLEPRAIQQLAYEFDLPNDLIADTTVGYFYSKLGLSFQITNKPNANASILETLVPFPERLKVCPMCLREKRKYRLVWQTSWAFVCTRHQILLQDTCPNCEQPIASERRTAGIPIDHLCCGNHLVGQPVCVQNLQELRRISIVAYPHIEHAQSILESVLHGQVEKVFQKPVPSSQYLKSCATLLKILWGFITPTLLMDVPNVVSSAFFDFVLAREAYFRFLDAEESDVTNVATAISRIWGTTEMMAATMPLVMQLFQLQSQQAMVNELISLLKQACYQRPEYPRWILSHLERQEFNDHHWQYILNELRNWLRKTYFLKKEDQEHVPNPYPL